MSTSLAMNESRTWESLSKVDRFVRIHFLFFTCLWPLLGAISVKPDLSIGELSALMVAALAYHLYAFVLNDVIDLPIDRTQPLRQQDPLVSGAITPTQALLLACSQPVIAVMPTLWLGGDVRAYAALAVAFVAMAVYNVWGKRCPVPPFTDFMQGVGWGSLAIYAAFALGLEPNAVTWLVFAYAVAYTLFMNGIHGGLRDLANDFARGARTTAIFLGARPAPDHRDPHVPAGVIVFASAALIAQIAIAVTLIVRNDFGYGPAVYTVTAAAAAALGAASLALMPIVMKPYAGAWDLAFRLQIYLVLMILPILFIGAANTAALALASLLKALSPVSYTHLTLPTILRV